VQQTSTPTLPDSQHVTLFSGQHLPEQERAQTQLPPPSQMWPSPQPVPGAAGMHRPALHKWQVPQDVPSAPNWHVPLAVQTWQVPQLVPGDWSTQTPFWHTRQVPQE
jgi:hypothetical protein